MPQLTKHGDLGYKIYRNIYCNSKKIYEEFSNRRVHSIIRNAIFKIAARFPQLPWVITELMRSSKENAALYKSRGKSVPAYTFHQDGLACDLRKRTIVGGVGVTTVRDFVNNEIQGLECIVESDHLHIESTGPRGVFPPRQIEADGTINSLEFDSPVVFTEEEINLATYTVRDGEGPNTRTIPQFLKDPPEAKKPGATQIGDTWLTVPPIDISIDTSDAHYSMDTLRSQGSPKINTGTSVQEMSLVLEFPSSASINFELRPIIAQFKRTPFTTMRNELVAKALTPIVGGPNDAMELVDGETIREGTNDLAVTKEYSAIPVCLRGISVATIPGYPDSLQATLTIMLFNHSPYYPSFGFVPDSEAASQNSWDRVGRLERKLIDNQTTPVADVRESPLYRRYYYGLLPEYNDLQDTERFGFDEYENPGTSFKATDHRIQLEEYTPETNDLLMFKYQYTTDTIFTRMHNLRDSIAAKQSAIVDIIEHREGLEDHGNSENITNTISQRWSILVEEADIALNLPARIAQRHLSSIGSLSSKISIILGNVGKNISERDAPQGSFETGRIESIGVRLQEMVKEIGGGDEPKALAKLKEVMDAIVESYTEELEARQGSDPLDEFFIIGGMSAGSVNGQDLPGYAKITGINATYDNPLTPIQIAQYNIPTYQHMGVGEFGVTINIETDSTELVKQLRVMNALMTHTAFTTNASNAEYYSYIDTRIEVILPGHLLRSLGINFLIIQNMSISNVKGSPGIYNISMRMQQADLLAFQAEQLTGTKVVTNEMVQYVIQELLVWVADRVSELDPNVTVEDIPDISKRGPRPTGRWSDLIEEMARDYIVLKSLRAQAKGWVGIPMGIVLGVAFGKDQVVADIIEKTVEGAARLRDIINTHNARAKIIRLIEHEPTRQSFNRENLHELWSAQLNKQQRPGKSGTVGSVKSIHTCYPDLDLPPINGTNRYTSPSFYLYDKIAMDAHIFSSINKSLNFMTNRVAQATIANKAVVGELKEELLSIGDLDESYSFIDRQGNNHTMGVPTGNTRKETEAQIIAFLDSERKLRGLKDDHPGKVHLNSKAEYTDFVRSVRDIQILRLIAMQAITSALFSNVKFDTISAADDRDVTKDLAAKFSPSDQSALFAVLDKIPSGDGISEKTLLQLRTFAKQAFDQKGGNFNNELTQRQAKEAVQNLLDEYIRMTQGMEQEAGLITKYYGMENYNSILRKLDILRRAEEVHKNDATGSYDRAFPTFKLYFIEEDASNWQLFDDFYSYSAVKEISIIKSKRAASDVAIIKLSNISGVLTNPNAVRDAEVTGQNTVEEQNIRSLFLRPGISVAIRMGYGTDPMQLPLVFMGSVSEVPAGEEIEIVCQGWGAELYNPVGSGAGIDISWGSFDKALGDVATRILNETGDGLDHFGRWSMFNERDEIRLSGQSRWAESILGAIGSDLLAEAVGKRNNMSENIYLSYSDSMLPWTNATFDWRIFNQTAWDALQEVALYVPNYVVRPMFFNDESSPNSTEQRMTLYLGPKDGYYKFSDDPLITNLAGQTAIVYESDFIRKKKFTDEELINLVSNDLRGLSSDPSFLKIFADEGIIAAITTKFLYSFRTTDPFYDGIKDRGYENLTEWINSPLDPSISTKLTPRYLIEEISTHSSAMVESHVESLISILNGSYDFNEMDSLHLTDIAILKAATSTGVTQTQFNQIMKGVFDGIRFGLTTDVVRVLKRGTVSEDAVGHESLKKRDQEGARRFFANHPHYKPFQNHWMVDSYRHIISNKITADAEGMANEVVLNFPSTYPLMTDPRIGATTFEALNDAVRSYRAVIDDDVKAEYRRVVETFQKNIDTNWYDEIGSFLSVKRAIGKDAIVDFYRSPTDKLWIPSYIRVANTILANHLQPMYTGELCIVGQPGIKPWDVLYIQDDYNDMQGPIEVDTVIHKMSRSEGFTTKIVPNAVVYQQNYASLLDPDFIQWEYYKGWVKTAWGATEGLLFGLPLKSLAKWVGGAAGTQRALGMNLSYPRDAAALSDSNMTALKRGGRYAGRGLLWLGKRAPLVGIITGGIDGFGETLSTWTNATGRLFGGNVVHYSGLWLNGQHLQAGLDGMRTNTIQDHRMGRYKHAFQELIFQVGGAAGPEPGDLDK
jgi:hypothetical protein